MNSFELYPYYMALIYLILLAGFFAKIGSKRVIGGFTSFWWGLLQPGIGIFFVLSSRRLDDKKRDLELIEKFKPIKNNNHGDD